MLRRFSFLVPSPAMAVAFAALLAACAGLAFAATGSSPFIHACANKKSGALRLARKCRRNERGVTWNITGPVGAQGPRGFNGVKGQPGAPGTAGARGGEGPQGIPGPISDVLPSGKTERGWFLADNPEMKKGDLLATSITFNFALPSAPAVSYVDEGGPPTPDCPGSVSSPQAARGKLCLYVGSRLHLVTTAPYVFGIDAISSNENDSTADPFGAQVRGQAAEAGRVEFHGSYAVTAP